MGAQRGLVRDHEPLETPWSITQSERLTWS
ncbi:unnamed protein product [Tetraodon nigroviridis]|uniref:(spotted green pufferfish) hypothetical protein n=1 Tax=Tetraodon nigroviridis TaxID=99883 RepID=Q4RNW4_TETNG|nr:unnamed protein product [Tetraodon nigroviridis]